MSASLPVAVLTVLGLVIAVLGLLAPAFEVLITGLVSIAVAGLLQVLGQRREN